MAQVLPFVTSRPTNSIWGNREQCAATHVTVPCHTDSGACRASPVVAGTVVCGCRPKSAVPSGSACCLALSADVEKPTVQAVETLELGKTVSRPKNT